MTIYVDPQTGAKHTYKYDALRRRIEKTVDVDGASPVTTKYSYGGNFQQIIEEQDGTGATVATYVYGNGVDEVISMSRDVDGNGSM